MKLHSNPLNSLKFTHANLVLIFILTAALVMGLMRLQKDGIRPPAPDGYARYALVLATTGVYSSQVKEARPTSGFGRAPGYPFFLAAMVMLDEQYKNYLKCHYLEKINTCSFNGGKIVYVQITMIAISVFLIYLTARYLGAPVVISALLCLFVLYPLVKEVTLYRASEALALPLFSAITYGLACWYTGRFRLFAALGTGAALGALALTRPAFLYLIPFVALSIVLLQPRTMNVAFPKRLLCAFVICVVSIAVVTPWMYRNFSNFDKFTIGSSGVIGVLSLRAQYNQMTLPEGLCAMVYWTHDFGDTLARKICRKEVWERFDFSSPNSYRELSDRNLSEIYKSTSSEKDVKEALLQEIFDKPLKHLLVSIPIAWRGMGSLLWYLPFILIGSLLLVARREWWTFGIFIPSLFVLFFHAGITHFRERYGIPMIYGLAPVAAVGCEWVFIKMKNTVAQPGKPNI
jgi:4-amino-4-deoxy-L-arabinose transferase-like glycosyltransferase